MKLVVLRSDGKILALHDLHQLELVQALPEYAGNDIVRASVSIRDIGKPLPEGSDFEVVRQVTSGGS